MAEPELAMPRADMKRVLVVAKKEPINVALSTGKDTGTVLLMMDKIKQPKAVLKLLTAGFPAAKEPRWGTAEVDPDDDPKLVKFRLNRAGGALARRIAKTLKGTGFSRVIILSDEDGSELDRHIGADDEEDGDAPAPAAAPPAFDAQAMQKQLAGLIGKVSALTDDARAGAVKLAQEIGGQLKTGALELAASGLEQLNALLAAAITSSAAAGSGAGAVAYGKGRLAWLATRQRLQGDLAKLRAEIDAEFEDDPDLGAVMAAYDQQTAPILAALDESLADKLDEIVNATDPAKRTALVQEAKTILKRYRDFVAGDALIAQLDVNPFVPLAIQKTLNGTLTALETTVR